jgi:hypothetical protein
MTVLTIRRHRVGAVNGAADEGTWKENSRVSRAFESNELMA